MQKKKGKTFSNGKVYSAEGLAKIDKGRRRERMLSPKHRAFILAYMANGHHITNAALSAGYPPKNADMLGWQLVHLNSRVSKEITRLTELAAKKCEISATYVLSSLKEIAEECKRRRVEIGPDGKEIERRGVVDSSGANRALELLGKNLKLFVDQIDVNRRSELADISDEELLDAVKGALKHKEK